MLSLTFTYCGTRGAATREIMGQRATDDQHSKLPAVWELFQVASMGLSLLQLLLHANQLGCTITLAF